MEAAIFGWPPSSFPERGNTMYEVPPRTVDALRRAMNMLERKEERGDETDTRTRAMSGDMKAARTVRRWDREDGAKQVPTCLPDGSDVTTIRQMVSLMGVHEKVAAAYVLGARDVHPQLYLEAKELLPPPESDKEGVAIMLFPDINDARQLNVDGGTPWDSLHVTVGYFGKVGEVEEEEVLQHARALADMFPPFFVDMNGVTRFSAPEGDALVVNVDAPVIEDIRRALVDLCEEQGTPLVRNHGYTPHMTIGYLDDVSESPISRWVARRVRMSTVVLGYGGSYTHLPFMGSVTGTKDVHSASVPCLRTTTSVAERFAGRVRTIHTKRRKKKPRKE
jgi:2'-5' RNA ligase